MHGPTNTNQQSGFTLIELMIVVILVALFASISFPTFKDSIDRNRRLSALDNTLALLAKARTASITRHARVAICPSTDQATCNGSNWEAGAIAFVDDGAGTGTAGDMNHNGSEELIAVAPATQGGLQIRSLNFGDSGGIGFRAGGMATERGTLVVCTGSGSPATALILNLSGQPRIASDDNGNNRVEDDQGADLAC